MPRFLPDSSVLVKAAHHLLDKHTLAVSAIADRLDSGDQMVIAGHTIAETYAVLTGLQSPYRTSGVRARQLILDNFLNGREVFSLDQNAYRDLLNRALEAGVAGAQIHDLVIFQTAVVARADVLLTFNARHFQRFAGQGIQIVVPGESPPETSR